jgi:hypothetical protein
MEKLKTALQKVWPLWALALLIIRPRRFMLEYVHAFKDYRLFRHSVQPYLEFLKRQPVPTHVEAQKSLLVVVGQAMNAQWLQIWGVLGAWARVEGYRVIAITSRSRPIQNLYLRLFRFDLLYLEDLRVNQTDVPPAVQAEFDRLETFHDFKEYEYQGMPLGKMALSTFSRHRATGIMDVADSDSRNSVRHWLERLYQVIHVADTIFARERVSMLYFTEVFMEEYGAFYYAALKRKLNIIRFAGTVRDNAIVVQHLNEESDRTHFSSISPISWAEILKAPDSFAMEAELDQSFLDRYGDRWALSKRNQPNTRIMPCDEARALLRVPDSKKIAVIYSHILYDTLFFNGEDLFDNYADWLVRSVKAACANPQVQWFVKVHPSNLWRGELEYYHGGKYEEVRLIEEYIGPLPDHVQLVYPDTLLSPYTWMQIADFGITVRGTSGIELGALGKTVITAGSGRYEDIGFSLNSSSVEEYLSVLARIPEVPAPTSDQTSLARRFAYATFCMKPFTLDFMKPVTRSGRDKIFSSDDLVYLGQFDAKLAAPASSIQRFSSWCQDRGNTDFLNPWPNR